MTRSMLVRLVILLLTVAMVSGCILVPVDDGGRRGGYYERDHGDHHGERHEGHERHEDHEDHH